MRAAHHGTISTRRQWANVSAKFSRARLTGTVGAVTNAEARLDLAVLPPITNNPATQTVGVGGPATFRVKATGSIPMNYP